MRLGWSPDLYIDFGSEHTVFAVGKQVLFEEPSCVAFYPETNTVLAVGLEAVGLQHAGQPTLRVSWPVRQGRVVEPVAAALFLQSLVRRVDTGAGYLAKLFGTQGVYVHPSAASPAELHVLQQVYSRAGLTGLKPVPLSSAVGAVLRKQALPPEICACSLNFDWTECTIFIGAHMAYSTHINWGVQEFRKLVLRVIAESAGAGVSVQTADQIVNKLLSCAVDTVTQEQPAKKIEKMSVKAKQFAATTAGTIIVTQALFAPHIAQVIRPLLDGLEQFFDTLPSEVLTAISVSGIRLLGEGEQIRGFSNYIAQQCATEVVWLADPKQAVLRGLQAMGKD